MRELWYADGYLLTNCGVQDITYGSAIYSSAAKRGDNTQIAQRNGSIWRPKMYEAATFTLNMIVYSPEGQRAALNAYRALLRVMTRQDELIRFEKVWENGADRYQCYGEVVQAIQPAPAGPKAFRMGFEVNVPGAFWESVEESVSATNRGDSLPQTLTLDQHADATAPMDDFKYIVAGPIVNPTVEAIRNDTSRVERWTYSGALTDAHTLTVDSKTWSVTGTGGLVIDQSKLDYTGNRFLTVHPQRPNASGSSPVLRLSGSGGAGSTRLTVVGRSKVLV